MVKKKTLYKNNVPYTMLYDDFNEEYMLNKIMIGSDGYALVCFNNKVYRLHRLFILGFENYSICPYVIDHINRNILDNRMENLRIVNKQKNEYNEKPLRTNNTSGIKGVLWDKENKKWYAQITYFGKTIKIGRYISKEDAIVARLKSEMLFCGKEYAPNRELFEQYGVNDITGLPDRVYNFYKKS